MKLDTILNMDVSTDGLTSDEIRIKILALQDAMVNLPQGQIECPLKHWFAPDIYAREIFLAKGTVIVGKIHKHAHLNIVSRGKCYVVTEFGQVVIDATESPVTFTSEAGTKRAVLVVEDVTWTTVHLNKSNTRELEILESEVIAPSYAELENFNANLKILGS